MFLCFNSDKSPRETGRLRVRAGVWQALALTWPLLAAVFVRTGRQKPFNRNDTAAVVFSVVSALQDRFWVR